MSCSDLVIENKSHPASNETPLSSKYYAHVAICMVIENKSTKPVHTRSVQTNMSAMNHKRRVDCYSQPSKLWPDSLVFYIAKCLPLCAFAV